MSIKIDPVSGLKFSTPVLQRRRKKLLVRVIRPLLMRRLNLAPGAGGAVFDAEEQAKYKAFKEARAGLLTIEMKGEFSRYLKMFIQPIQCPVKR